MMTAGDRGLAAVVTTLMALVLVEVTTAQTAGELTAKGVDRTQAASPPAGVCPPFHLRDEDGNVINPVKDENADKPYSPKQTCGGCHDYEKITQGYHFMQGMGEKPTAEQAARCLWATTPGNFGGNWCSPAPLYRYLSPKKNESAATVDLTSFTFFTSRLRACHPGGGSAEYDREGKRYDRWMSHRQERPFFPAATTTSTATITKQGGAKRAFWKPTASCATCPDTILSSARATWGLESPLGGDRRLEARLYQGLGPSRGSGRGRLQQGIVQSRRHGGGRTSSASLATKSA